ncbi:glutathione S-transferase family protein [filamentous cyanobacterium CCP5]|nr:glutathione S-transferase family protein [filamentous cyanobacterium CCP5]
MAKFTIYGPALSTYVRTVRLILESVGADYDLQEIDILTGENEQPAYLAKHPFGKVPTLEVDGQLLYETNAISEYLDATVAGDRFRPAEPMARAKMRQIMAIVDSYLYAPTISTIVIQRLIVPSQDGQTDEAAVAAALPKTQTALKAIEAISTFGPYLLGSNLTLADFFLMPIFFYLSRTPEFEAATSDTPQLKAWWETTGQDQTLAKVTG